MSANFNKRLFLALAACYFVISINFGVRYTYGLLTVEMINDMNFSNQDIGVMVSCYLLSYALTGFVTGHLIDRKGAKMTILTMFPLLGMGSMLISMTSSIVSGVLFSVIAGVGASAGWSPVIIWSQKLYPKKRGLIVGIMESGTKLCPFLIALAIPQIVPMFGWRGVWLLLGAIALLSILLVSLAHEPKAEGSNSRSKEKYLDNVGVILRNRYTWLIGISYALSAFAIMVHVTFYKAYLSRELMISVDVSTLLYGLMNFAGFIGALTVPALSDKIGRRPLIMACNAILVASLIGFLFSNSILGLILFTVLIGIDLGAKWPLYAAFVKDLYDWKIAGLATALSGLFSGLGSISAPYISGVLADMYSTYKISYTVGIVAGVTAIALIAVAKSKN
ncbi:MAG: MFS transporter [Candidatus Bathyarchaeia archaeon]